MFYSHEILTSHRYGVATVWLVATVGVRSNARKLSKKAIQEVNVAKACETISEPPGAPIALRLQGNLLYGVSRVYSQQYGYLLTDTEKMQMHMRTFVRTWQTNALDPEAGKAQRDQLIILDDPDFIPDMNLPEFNFDNNGNLVLPNLSQLSGKTSSQLSPLEASRTPEVPFIDLEIRHSSSLSNLNLDSPFGGNGKSAQQKDDGLMPMVFGDEEELPFADFGLMIDDEGNVVEEPELPAHKSAHPEVDNELVQPASGDQIQQPEEEGAPIIDFDGDIQMNFGEEPLPDAEALPARVQKKASFEDMSSESAVAPSRKARRSKVLKLDQGDSRVSRIELKNWNSDYVANMKLARNTHKPIPAAQAKKNAFNLTFGLGVASIGGPSPIPGFIHPLSELFSGPELQARILGQPLVDDEADSQQGRRRSASVAFEEDEEAQERRVRLKLDDHGEQQGRGDQDAQVEDNPLIFDNDVEIGRDPGSAISEIMSSVPWNRPPSVVPSSAQSQKSAQARLQTGRHGESSPLVGRGSLLPEIERFSDNAPAAFGSDGFGPLPDQGSSFSEFGPAAGVSTQEAQTSQFMRQALDREGANFLGFVQRVAKEDGEDREDPDCPDRRWVDFDALIRAPDNTKAVAAQAFYHVLSLATKGAMEVQQDGTEDMEPFGTIKLGIDVTAEDGDDVAENIVAA